MGVKNSEKHFRRNEEYAPRTGVVRTLRLTEKQYENISMISRIEDLQERSIVEEGTKTYREIYENYDITEKTIAYWKNAKQLYQSLDETQRNIFMGIIRQTIIDTISTLFLRILELYGTDML